MEIVVVTCFVQFAYIGGAFYMFKTHAHYMVDDQLSEQNLSIAEIEALPSASTGN